jgi:hypothetical protein
MKSTEPSSAPSNASDPPRLSQGVRTILSLVLFVHLFALGVAMLSNPRDGMTSPLLLRLGGIRFLSGYLQLLWMDLGYDYFHTYGYNEFVASISSDHQAEIELKMADGSTQTIVSPPVDLPAFRARRYTNLWNSAGRTVGESGVESVLPDMVAESLLRQRGAEMATIRIQRRLPLTIEQAGSRGRQPADAPRTVYTGVGQMKSGQFIYQKLESTGDTAPAAGSPASAPASSAPPARRTGSTSAPTSAAQSSPAAGGNSTTPRPLFPAGRQP